MGSERGSLLAANPGLYSSTAEQGAPFGTVLEVGDGREFVYGRAGAVAVVGGRMYQSPVMIDDHAGTGRALDAPAIGTRVITLTTVTTATTENQYAEGYLVIVNDTGGIAGAGACYKISGHPGQAAGAEPFTLFDPLYEAISAGSTGALVAHPGNLVIISTAVITAPLFGVAVRDLVINNYGWFQRKGICGCLQDGVVVPGDIVATSDGIAGAIQPVTATQAVDEFEVGQAVADTADADIAVIDLRL